MKSRNRIVTKEFNDKKYWIERHNDFKEKLCAVGLKSSSERTNSFTHEIVAFQLRRLLKQLGIGPGATCLDAGCGSGFFSKRLESWGYKVTAIDISEAALAQITSKRIKKEAAPLSRLTFDHDFDFVICFDVLYHILDDKDWEKSLMAVCKASNKYLFLHERFSLLPPIIQSRHIKARTYRQQAAVIKKMGFREIASSPTFFFARRLIFYRISHIFLFLYKLDNFIINRITNTPLNFLGSHHIKVFQRVS